MTRVFVFRKAEAKTFCCESLGLGEWISLLFTG